jgi:hypothetical protein
MQWYKGRLCHLLISQRLNWWLNVNLCSMLELTPFRYLINGIKGPFGRVFRLQSWSCCIFLQQQEGSWGRRRGLSEGILGSLIKSTAFAQQPAGQAGCDLRGQGYRYCMFLKKKTHLYIFLSIIATRHRAQIPQCEDTWTSDRCTQLSNSSWTATIIRWRR